MCLQLRTWVRLVGQRLRTIKAEETGTELVEAALVIPLLLTFLVGIVSMGRGYNVYQTVTRAAREGAKSLVLTSCATCGNAPYTAAEVQQNFVNPVLVSNNLNPARVAGYNSQFVWLDPAGSPPQVCGVAISFSYPYQLVVPFTSVNMTTVSIGARVQMRLENQPPSCPAGSAVP